MNFAKGSENNAEFCRKKYATMLQKIAKTFAKLSRTDFPILLN